jgi:threonine/homoserine/homoserine lactone efflux protein
MVGLAPLLRRDMFFVFVSFSGAAILAWMSFGMFRSLPGLRIDWDAGEGRSGNIVAAGALLSIANPYWVVWWATIGLSFLSRSQEAGLLGILFFFLGHQSADFAWYTVVSTAVGKGRRFFSDRIYRGIIAASAVILVGFALYFSWSGFDRLGLV